ncbi:Ig-like domain-containing protein [Aquimarina sp. 2201CG5-10]|uniref:Ig-like domain-containing protein n=1 Tax=Aquimarina callyspongiae TaxID=3098150 RepID=UPI002AB34B59|nr:Ig-like domain-containing protein [Aquimarina sp. 2201CG5-10]MDY8135237.1 Ig-like domain-containing protein [Aquimarina sp. 2201CG5-10]
MSKRLYTLVFAALCIILVVNCAKRGSITGGEKDEIPPEFVRAIPPNFSTSYNKEEIRVYFDEYIKLDDPQKQIIISPPMDPKPTILPLGGASKFVRIKFLDTLLENTTYSINFGESIVDNNEGNAFPFFRYVFSTGESLDSLSIKGTIVDAIQKKVDPFITVALYEINEEYSDSLVYKTVPRYITSTLDSINFNFYNLKEGTYKLIALKDAATNYTYEPKQDKIGFYEEVITLPADTAKFFSVNIFKEILDFRALKPKQVSKNEFIFGYEGVLDSMKIKLLSEAPDNFETRIIPDKEKDTLHYWFKPFFEADSLIFEVTNSKNYRDTIITRFKDQYKDSLKLTSDVKGNLALNKDFVISANTPLESIDEKLITLKDKDTVEVPFKVQLNKVDNEATITFDKAESNSYSLTFLPEAVKDFIGNANDTIYFRFRTKKLADYGKIFMTLQNVKQYPVLVQATTEKGEVISEKIAVNEETLIFDYLNPGKYNIRVIHDTNKNGKWDTGNFLKTIQPEKVSYFPDLIDVRANWELKQTFILK